MSRPRLRSHARARSSGLIALLVAVACATPERSGRPQIRELEFHGNRAIGSAELRAHLLSGAPSWRPWKADPELDEATLAEDMLRIRRLYRRHGYFDASADYALQWEPSRERVGIEIRIEEGLPVELASVRVDLGALPGGSAEWSDELAASLPLQVGDVFSLDDYDAAKRQLLGELADRGHPRAQVLGGAEIDAAQRRAAITWTVDPGPRVQFGEAQVVGLGEVEERLVRREIAWQPGDLYSTRALRETERRIYDLELFQSVAVRSRPAPPDGAARDDSVWPIEVELVERPPRSLRAGIGYGSEEGVRALVGWQRRNFLGGARRLELSARYSSLLQGIEAALAQPRFLDGNIALRSSARLERERAESFDADRALANVSLVRPIAGPWSASLGYSLEHDDVTDVSRSAQETLDDPRESVTLSYLEAGISRRTLSGGATPTGGSSLALATQFSSGLLGSQHDYLKTTADWRTFLPVYGSVLALRLRAGSIQPLASTQPEQLPLVVRFFSGGTNSVRGFDYQELGPLDEGGEPLGGASLAEAGVELRMPLWRRLGGVVFVDAGQVDLEPFRFKLDQIEYSAGTGLRYDTPVGPLRIDLGWVINPSDEVDGFRVHVAVGHAF